MIPAFILPALLQGAMPPEPIKPPYTPPKVEEKKQPEKPYWRHPWDGKLYWKTGLG